MKLRKVISGGQTGADKTALVEAARIGLRTGGTCPKGCRTDEGPDPELVSKYGLVESNFDTYPPRTRANVARSGVTVWFGKLDSPECWCTRKACKDHNKDFYPNPDADTIRKLVRLFEVWNVACNRRSKNPNVIEQVQKAFKIVEEELNEGTHKEEAVPGLAEGSR